MGDSPVIHDSTHNDGYYEKKYSFTFAFLEAFFAHLRALPASESVRQCAHTNGPKIHMQLEAHKRARLA